MHARRCIQGHEKPTTAPKSVVTMAHSLLISVPGHHRKKSKPCNHQKDQGCWRQHLLTLVRRTAAANEQRLHHNVCTTLYMARLLLRFDLLVPMLFQIQLINADCICSRLQSHRFWCPPVEWDWQPPLFWATSRAGRSRLFRLAGFRV